MSDSLRDQLLQAGFKETQARKAPKKNSQAKQAKQSKQSHKHKKNQPGANPSASKATSTRAGKPQKPQKTNQATPAVSAAEQEQLAQKKAIKEKIRLLIEEHRVKEHTGEEIYSYQIGSRVRQLFVKPEHRKSLSDGTLVITRLNGNTFLIPPAVAEQVLALNPDWAIIHNQSPESKEDPAYADYQIPDDLSW
ncbi:MAG: DUF2058 domain-containing protein [Gammaproteobacteria bacterium]|nr:DUF2058 domain-containing protein [Gammaproteobacteria bacterium]